MRLWYRAQTCFLEQFSSGRMGMSLTAQGLGIVQQKLMGCWKGVVRLGARKVDTSLFKTFLLPFYISEICHPEL